jgi:hypothetical protein
LNRHRALRSLTTGGDAAAVSNGLAARLCGSRFAFRHFVLCRIESRREDNLLVVHLSGRFTGAHVPDLLKTCTQPPETVIELDDLASADALGLEALLLIEQQGARLVALPKYLRLKLDALTPERRA